MSDWHETHHDSFHRAMCKSSNDSKFIVGRAYDAINKGLYFHIRNEKDEIESISMEDFSQCFDSFMIYFSVPTGIGIAKSVKDGVISLDFDIS